MKHRDRVLMALNHKEPDRCPMQISFTPEFASRLKRELRLTGEDFHNPHGGGNTYVMERALDEDVSPALQAVERRHSGCAADHRHKRSKRQRELARSFFKRTC